ALEEFGVAVDLKWVNDLLVKSRKIGGILAETAETDRGPAVVIGIGINLRSRAMPPEIAEIATAIEAETGTLVSALSMESALIRYLVYFYDIISGPDGCLKIREEWQKRSTYANGKFVRVTTEDAVITGRTDGLEKDGGLRVITDSGLVVIRAGDVENLRFEGASAAPEQRVN
ncbi:MAG: biotin--[acetyl-CoA-carboxylase] ligase, partial [Blastocatellia bacterium]